MNQTTPLLFPLLLLLPLPSDPLPLLRSSSSGGGVVLRLHVEVRQHAHQPRRPAEEGHLYVCVGWCLVLMC